MEIQQIDILLRLIIAHLLADFVFQTDAIVKGKKNKGLGSVNFYLHLLFVGILNYVLLAQWTNWYAPLILLIIHGIIDLAKIKLNKDNAWVYMGDQLLHILSIVVVWFLLTENSLVNLINQSIEYYSWSNKYLTICIVYILISLPSGVLIGYLTKKWQEDLATNGDESLKSAGKWIGMIERFLILSFILINQWTPIGFLLAAKSVFRFGDLKGGKEQKKTEYILVGTLLSFSIAIFLGLFLRYLIKYLW